ncbi:hypothetical protein [Flavobacterium sp.]
MRNLKQLAILGIITLSIFGCSPSPAPASCNTVGTDFQNLNTATLASNPLFDDYTTMDLVTHEYTFEVGTNKTICSIGYQGNANLFAANIPYTIEIFNNTTSTMVYTGSHVFDSAMIDYQSIAPTNLIAGESYTIRRIASNYLSNIGNTIGRICRFNNGSVPFPVNSGALTIYSSNFYGTGGPVPNFGIPHIDIVFQ